MIRLLLLIAVISSCCVCDISEILPVCDAVGSEPADLTTLIQSLDEGIGLHIESSCVFVKETDRSNFSVEEFLYKEKLHYDAGFSSSSEAKKYVIVLDGSKGFVASLKKRGSNCEKKTSVSQWDNKSASLLNDTISEEYVSLAWIFQNADQRTWTRTVSEKERMVKFVSCSSGGYPSIQFNFLRMNEDNSVTLGSLLEVMVAFSSNEYSLFSVYEMDYIFKNESSLEQLEQNFGLFQPPTGETCDNYLKEGVNEETLPTVKKFPDAMSLSSEIVDFGAKKISYTREVYSFAQNLSRIELHSGGRAANFVSPRFNEPTAKNHPVTMIHDFKSGLVFVIDMQSDFCEILSMEDYYRNNDDIPPDMNPGCTSESSNEDHCMDMYHPYEIHSFKDYKYAGKCVSQGQIPGFKFIMDKRPLVHEACFADGTWSIGYVQKSSNFFDQYSLPFYIKTYNMSANRTSPDFEPHLLKVVHFYDVDFTPPDASYFDISKCFGAPDESKHYLVQTTGRTQRCEDEDCDIEADSSESPLFYKISLFTSKLRSSLAEKLNVAPIRIFDLFVEEPESSLEWADHDLIVGFGLLDIDYQYLTSEANQLSFKQARDQYRPLKKVEEDIANLLASDDGFKIVFHWNDSYFFKDESVEGKPTITKEAVFQETITVTTMKKIDQQSFNEMSKAADEVLETENAANAAAAEGGIGAGAVVAVAFLMAILGVAIGIAVGYKLWKSGTSFGYTIHTNI